MKSFFKKMQWIFKNCKIAIPFIILLIVLGSCTSLISVYKSLTIKSLIDSINVSKNQTTKYIIITACIMLSVIIIGSIKSIISSYSSGKLQNIIQLKLFNTILKSKWIDLTKFHSVDILTRFNNDISTITNLMISSIPEIISLLVMLVSSFFALFSISKTMSLFALIIFPFLILLSKIYGRKLKYFYLEFQKKESLCSSFVQECINNILIVKSFTLEKFKSSNLAKIHKSRLDLSMKKSYFSCISNGLLSLSGSIGFFAVLVWGSYNISSGNSTYGSLTAMIQLFGSIQGPIFGLSSSFPQLISAIAAIDRLQEIENIDKEDYSELNYNNKTIDISIRNVSFGYNSSDLILKNVSLDIDNNDIVGIIGPSGGGKTTLIRLLQALIYPTSGKILINNENLSVDHRQLFSYVPQGNTLFSGTIRDNLILSDNDLNDLDIYEALKQASAYDFVINLKDKLDTVIGEKALGLSEGQAQRLCIARALLRKKPLLILDESTSALDSDTEYNILNSIKNLKNCTCIIITHRESALSICDKIYKINNSKVKQLFIVS